MVYILNSNTLIWSCCFHITSIVCEKNPGVKLSSQLKGCLEHGRWHLLLKTKKKKIALVIVVKTLTFESEIVYRFRHKWVYRWSILLYALSHLLEEREESIFWGEEGRKGNDQHISTSTGTCRLKSATNSSSLGFWSPNFQSLLGTTLFIPITACYYSELCSAWMSYSGVQFLLTKAQ